MHDTLPIHCKALQRCFTIRIWDDSFVPQAGWVTTATLDKISGEQVIVLFATLATQALTAIFYLLTVIKWNA